MNNEILKIIRIKLIEKNKSEKELIEFLDLSYQVWLNRKSGRNKITIDELKKISEFFDCDIKDFF